MFDGGRHQNWKLRMKLRSPTMSKAAHGQGDPVDHEIALALRPGVFIHDRACFAFVSGLEGVAGGVAELVGSDSARAVTLFETILAGCHEKAEEVDDSSGSFGRFVRGLFCGWVTARQAAGADRDETATRLLDWMEDDPFGYCTHLEKDLANVLDTGGRAALAEQVRARFELAAAETPRPDTPTFRDPGYLCRRWGKVLRALYVAQRDVAAYVSLAERTGPSGEDCHAIATLLASRRRLEEALAWVERGAVIDGGGPYATSALHDLAKLRRELLARLGRRDEAREDAWAEFRKYPSTFTYDELMKFVPKTDCRAWHEKAIEAAAGTHLGSLVELLLETKEIERLADLVGRTSDAALEDESHYVTEPAAKALERAHPGVAARLWRAQGMRIVNAGKSKYYAAAIRNFGDAKRCYERAGLADEWARTVIEVRAAHHRKTGFMPGFEKVARGSGPIDEPSFLDRARTRWGGRRADAEP